MNDIEFFLSKRNQAAKSAKQSALEPYKDEIFQLKNMGYAEQVIVEFLSEMKGVKISRQALNKFIRSRSTRIQNMPTKTPQTPQTPQDNIATPSTQFPQNQVENTPVRRGLHKPTPTRKFDWENRPDPESLK